MIPAETIADVKARVELLAFCESVGIKLKRAGKGYLGLCPLHDDHRPSLSVDPVKQSWCCLGACSASGKVVGGDVIELARRVWGVSFVEALRRLNGGTLERGSSPSPTPAPSRPSLHVVRGPSASRARPAARSPHPPRPDLLAQVASVYRAGLGSSADAKDYLASRGLTNAALLSALEVGYADGSLLERAPEGSETYEALRTLGVIQTDDDGRNPRELFRGCVVVPLRDLAGDVVGFYGRAVSRDAHLYLPGPRRGLVNAVCAATADELVLTESVLDAVSFLQAGVPNAIPLYGTNGYTQGHEALLEKHRIRRVILALDADEAGRKAAHALSEKLGARGIEVLDVVLPVKDPNQLLVAEGAEGFAKTWKRLVAEVRGDRSPKTPSAGRELISSAAASSPAPEPEPEGPEPAAKEEEPGLARDDTGAYLLSLGPRTYRVSGLSASGVDRLRVTLRVDQAGRFFVDTFDLYSSRGRRTFVEGAVKALHLPEDDETLGDELGTVIEALERQRLALRGQGEKSGPAAMTAADRAAAMAMLTGDVLSALRRDFHAVGCVGEDTAMLIGYFALVSRKLDEPLSVLFCARSGAGKSTLQDRLCDFCPPEDLVKYTRISGQVLFYKDEDALKHKLLAVDEEDGASQAAYALRSLLSSGYLSCSVTRSDPSTGRQVADDRKVNGPTTVFLTTAHPEAFDYETRNRYVLVTVDESRAQTERILELQRWNETVEGLLARERRKAVFKRHHDAQRLLEPLEVVIPVELAYPSGQLILRREQKKYLALVKAIALLHQHQRPRKTLDVDGRKVSYVEATEKDVAIARELSTVILARNLDELAPPSRSLLGVMREIVTAKRKALAESAAGDGSEKKEEAPVARAPRRYVLKRDGPDERLAIARQEIQAATGLSYWHVRTYIAQLVEYEYVGQARGANGRSLYRLLWEGEPGPERG